MRAIRWIFVYDTLMLCVTLIVFIMLMKKNAFQGFFEGFFVIAIQVPRVVTQIVLIIKNYRRDWAFVCVSARVTTLVTGLAAVAYLFALIIYEVLRYGLDKGGKRVLVITMLVSAIFVTIDSYFC